MNRPPSAVAWDIDGTLIDSEALHHQALMAVSGRLGVPIAADDDRFLGIGMDQVWHALRPQYGARVEREDWLAEIMAAYRDAADGLRAFPGALDAVRRLADLGIPQCCVSNSARAVVDVNLAALGLLPLLRFSISRDDVARGKPDPLPYRAACRMLGLPPAAVLAIEDSDPGAQSARAAGCRVFRIDNGRDYPAVLALFATRQKE